MSTEKLYQQIKAPMENRLSGAFKPIAPRREFVHKLGNRIQHSNRVTIVNHVANWHVLAALIAGLVSLAVLLAMLGRALVSLAGKKRPTTS
ncbi:MAG TPA: hypothetical protein VMC09_14030 [Anaerolineales bacterium]|nr:hypothetical protein [Anaerolineales bacterium]